MRYNTARNTTDIIERKPKRRLSYKFALGRFMRERAYQADLINVLRDMFPGCVILKNDSAYIQGIPDLTVLFNDRWAMLEVKPFKKAPVRPNQDYYIRVLNDMSFAAFIYPENEEDVLNELQRAFGYVW